jgi:Tol biopolymer transport system component
VANARRPTRIAPLERRASVPHGGPARPWKSIVFAQRDSADSDASIWTASADGTGARLLYDGRKNGCDAVYHPAWSPDGSRLAFVCYQGNAGTPQTPNAALLRVLDVAAQQVTTVATTHWPDRLDNPPA